MKKVHAGWDGHSRPIIILEDDCGCTWTRDGKSRIWVCSDCLRKASA